MKRILIIDDSPLLHKIYGSQLEEAGFEVLHAEDGLLGINAALTQLPDLILSDIQMPKVNGYQVCRLLKDQPTTGNIPIIMMTSRDTPQFASDPEHWSLETGADGFMDKDSNLSVVPIIQPLLEKMAKRESSTIGKGKPMSELEILMALSDLLGKQLYKDVTRLQELDERKNAFVANVSHEFKSPLMILKLGLGNLLMEGLYGPLAPKQKKAVETSLRVVDRLTRLVTDLLDLAKMEAGKMGLEKGSVDLKAMADEMLDNFDVAVKEKKMIIKKDFSPSLPPMSADRDRLMQVFVNLFSNSLKYTQDGGTVTVRLIEKDGTARIEFQDNGPGMSPENLQKIFDKFERVTTEKREGTGLGLPIARDIVILHGGKVWAESEEGKGAKFIVELPLGKSS